MEESGNEIKWKEMSERSWKPHSDAAFLWQCYKTGSWAGRCFYLPPHTTIAHKPANPCLLCGYILTVQCLWRQNCSTIGQWPHGTQVHDWEQVKLTLSYRDCTVFSQTKQPIPTIPHTWSVEAFYSQKIYKLHVHKKTSVQVLLQPESGSRGQQSKQRSPVCPSLHHSSEEIPRYSQASWREQQGAFTPHSPRPRSKKPSVLMDVTRSVQNRAGLDSSGSSTDINNLERILDLKACFWLE